MIDYRRHYSGHSLADARLEAWSILLGRHNQAEYRRRPHRGMLPDVIVDPPRRPSFSNLLAGWLMAASVGTAMGRAVSKAYKEDVVAAGADSPEPATNKLSRAA